MSDPARDPAWARLLQRARRSFERTGGRLDTSIFLDAPSEDERLLIIGITGVHRAPGVRRVTLRLSEVDAYLLQAYGRSLLSVFGPALRNRPAERSLAAAARETLLGQAYGSRHNGAEWFERWLRGIQQDGSVARLIRAGRDLAPVLTVLDALSRPIIYNGHLDSPRENQQQPNEQVLTPLRVGTTPHQRSRLPTTSRGTICRQDSKSWFEECSPTGGYRYRV